MLDTPITWGDAIHLALAWGVLRGGLWLFWRLLVKSDRRRTTPEDAAAFDARERERRRVVDLALLRARARAQSGIGHAFPASSPGTKPDWFCPECGRREHTPICSRGR